PDQPIQVDVFDGEPAEVVPHAIENVLDLHRGLVRIGRHQIGARGAMAAQPRSDRAQRPGGKIRGANDVQLAARFSAVRNRTTWIELRAILLPSRQYST